MWLSETSVRLELKVAGTTGSNNRWDADDRFVGVADASGFAAAIEELAALAHWPGWVAEDPDVHLVPHLTAAAVEGLRLVSCRTRAHGVLNVAVQYSPGLSRARFGCGHGPRPWVMHAGTWMWRRGLSLCPPVAVSCSQLPRHFPGPGQVE